MYGAQAFAAVQASVVHLQGVPLSKRFALVPLGPPLLTYSSTCKACAWECCSRTAAHVLHLGSKRVGSGS